MLYRNALLGCAFAAGLVYGQQSSGWRDANAPQPEQGNAPAATGDSPQLTLPAGTWISVRTDEVLSSDHNLPGDAFSATLAQPLVANGFVVARRGQILSGRVTDAVKAGRIREPRGWRWS